MNKKLIQLLTRSNYNSFDSDDISINEINNPDSLDMYQINIIDLRSSNIWSNTKNSYNSVNIANDLIHLSTMINNSQDTKIIYIYPQDINFEYNYFSGKYMSRSKLKNILHELEVNILIKYLKLPYTSLTFERTQTQISTHTISSDFYFNVDHIVLTKSILSNKATTIEVDDIILTTLSINNTEELFDFLNLLNLIKIKDNIPSWINDVIFYDDKKHKSTIQENISIIENAQNNIQEANDFLNRNNKYKSILYLNGNDLVNVVFEILEQILNCDLTGFIDNKNEDFLIELEKINFIGEIKGVSTNVKSEHISQLDVHYQNYLDKISESISTKTKKSLLIICHQRNKELLQREQIHEKQIQLAKRNESLIIETKSLLEIFEAFLLKKITTNEIINLFHDNSGLLKFNNS